MKALRIVVDCAQCGQLGAGLSTDPLTGPRHHPGWTRWDELNSLAERHPHATRTHAAEAR